MAHANHLLNFTAAMSSVDWTKSLDQRLNQEYKVEKRLNYRPKVRTLQK